MSCLVLWEDDSSVPSLEVCFHIEILMMLYATYLQSSFCIGFKPVRLVFLPFEIDLIHYIPSGGVICLSGIYANVSHPLFIYV